MNVIRMAAKTTGVASQYGNKGNELVMKYFIKHEHVHTLGSRLSPELMFSAND